MKSFMFYILLVATLFSTALLKAQTGSFESLKTQAESAYAEHSYQKAHDLYAEASQLALAPPDKRWVDFRLADTTWRAQAESQSSDPSKLDAARHDLEVLIRDITQPEDRDRVWAEVNESLGDFNWTRRGAYNWGEALSHYQAALDWWAGSSDLTPARDRYLAMVWKMAQRSRTGRFSPYGGYSNSIPLNILENAVQIAVTDNDRAYAHYLVAMTLRNQTADARSMMRISKEFEAALVGGKSNPWFNDALYNYAEWLERSGRLTFQKDGQPETHPDFVKAAAMYRRITTEFRKGETQYYETAQNRLNAITLPSLTVGTSNIFLPGSEIQFQLNWRNVKTVHFALYPVDLSKDIRFQGQKGQTYEWIQLIDHSSRNPVYEWSKETEDQGDFVPGNETVHLDRKLAPGAYLLEASGGKADARDLILISDGALVAKTVGHQVLVYFCDVVSGAPSGDSAIRLVERNETYSNGTSVVTWKTIDKTTDSNGLAVFDLGGGVTSAQLFISASKGDRQSFTLANTYSYSTPAQEWKIYAFTDRPAYRPGDTVQWKTIARQYHDSVYLTPANRSLNYQIVDPRGSKVKDGVLTLNSFGSGWDSLELTDKMALGSYRITFWEDLKKPPIGSAELFRLEEYKLPEFKVEVHTPEANGRKKTFLLGDTVSADIQADYYSGGPVTDASVEISVYQQPFFRIYRPPHEFPWLYDEQRNYSYGSHGQVIKHEIVKTDASGKAIISFETPVGETNDLEYYIEAKVTDASRREIVGSGSVRVTRQSYYVYPRAEHNLYHPGDKVRFNLKALDANDQPVQANGTVSITRDFWYEIWISPEGKEVKGADLDRFRHNLSIFPPPPLSDGQSWTLKFRGYQHDEILTQSISTKEDGTAELDFTPDRDGYYKAAWASRDVDGAPIQASTTVWVTSHASSELGYHHDGVEIILDKDTFRAGQTAPILLTSPVSGRYVLFTVEGPELYRYQLVHMEGTATLVELPVEDRYIPNIFLSATMVNDCQISIDTKSIVIPPAKHFLNVEVSSNRKTFQPRDEGTFTITTRDSDGKPVSAEVALGLADESVYYIQSGLAGDIRQFFYGDKRWNQVQNQSTFSQRSFVKLIQIPNGAWMDETQWRDSWLAGGVGYGVGSGTGAGRGLGNAIVGGQVGGVLGGVVDRVTTTESVAVNGSIQALPTYSIARSDKAMMAMAPSAPAPSQAQEVTVRTDFRPTAFWQPDIVTDKDGHATVRVKFPDSLTTWKAVARVETTENQFGNGDTSVQTQLPLIVRLEVPRFFLVGDKVTVSAVVNNNTDQPINGRPRLQVDGLVIEGAQSGSVPNEFQGPAIEVPAHGETRVDWQAVVQKPGLAKLKVIVQSEKYSDAMEKTIPVYEHGIEKFLAKSGKLRGQEAIVTLNIPKDRKPETTQMLVQVSPSMAVTMLDALPYLIDYPYGCVEQTMSRFLPAAVTAKTLKDLGISRATVMNHLFGGIEQSYAAQTHPGGARNLDQLDSIIQQSLDRLYDFQHSDGGWGWWKEGETDRFMTAYTVWGLALARNAGIEVKPDVIDKAVRYLSVHLVDEKDHYDMQAWMLYALVSGASNSSDQEFIQRAVENLWAQRDQLNAYTRALFALSTHALGDEQKSQVLIRNLENGVKIDRRPDTSILLPGAKEENPEVQATAHWGEDGIYWRWSDGGVEATAFALKALLAIDPQNKLIEPVTNWLIKNRRGAQWNSTRNTAITILALDDYLRTSGELNPNVEFQVLVNGHAVAHRTVTKDDVLTAPSQFLVDSQYLVDGPNKVEIRKISGASPLYFSVQTKFFSLEEPIKAAGNEIFVRRQYYLMVGHPTLLKGYVYDQQLLEDGDSVKSGDRIHTVITIEGKNNYEYLVFEDLKPAGLEAVQIQSGSPLYAKELKPGAVQKDEKTLIEGSVSNTSSFTGQTRWVYQELRDRKIAMFIDKLPQGLWQIQYDLRAEAPGQFHALPTLGYAMYVPEIRANSDETHINVIDQK
ncbi:MAG: alpha-2-macroglobulin family protein [Acidobacteriia bacterium]|nr:alpha-2-macroglobulin family protein [Terriglobia bacterium]